MKLFRVPTNVYVNCSHAGQQVMLLSILHERLDRTTIGCLSPSLPHFSLTLYWCIRCICRAALWNSPTWETSFCPVAANTWHNSIGGLISNTRMRERRIRFLFGLWYPVTWCNGRRFTSQILYYFWTLCATYTVLVWQDLFTHSK